MIGDEQNKEILFELKSFNLKHLVYFQFTMINRSDVISIYKRLKRTINGIDAQNKREGYLKKFHKEFKKNVNVTDPTKKSELYEYAKSKLGYLEVISTYKHSTVPYERLIYKNGEIVEGSAEIRNSHFKDQRLDPDDLAKHKRLLRRQNFQDRHMPLRWGE